MAGTPIPITTIPRVRRKKEAPTRSETVNVGDAERWVSVALGASLAVSGLKRRSLGGLLLGAIGGAFVYRGLSGHCPAYQALRMDTAQPDKSGILVERSVTINRPRNELFMFWRNFENLPQVMDHLDEVRLLDSERSHWVARAPAGARVEWDAEIVAEKQDALISWRSIEGSGIDNRGSVRFTPAPGNRGTEVKVTLQYSPPGGVVGAAVAKLFGEEPEIQVENDLRRFKQLMEAGEIPTTAGQPSGPQYEE